MLMNRFTIFPMNGHWGKLAGGIIATLSAFLMLLIAISDVIPERILAKELQLPIMLWSMGVGLFLMTFSKERREDERVIRIRYMALRGLAMLFGISQIALFMPMIIGVPNATLEFLKDPVQVIIFALIIPLMIYQAIFHFGLYFDPEWAHTNGTGEMNLRESKIMRWILIVPLLVAVIFVLIGILN